MPNTFARSYQHCPCGCGCPLVGGYSVARDQGSRNSWLVVYEQPSWACCNQYGCEIMAEYPTRVQAEDACIRYSAPNTSARYGNGRVEVNPARSRVHRNPAPAPYPQAEVRALLDTLLDSIERNKGGEAMWEALHSPMGVRTLQVSLLSLMQNLLQDAELHIKLGRRLPDNMLAYFRGQGKVLDVAPEMTQSTAMWYKNQNEAMRKAFVQAALAKKAQEFGAELNTSALR